MALTANEQLQVITGEYNPNQGPGSDPLPIDTTNQTAVTFGINFYLNQKIFPTVDGAGNPINELASAYVSKMRTSIQEIFAARAETRNKIIRLVMGTLGNTAITWAQFQSLSEEQWQVAVTNIIDVVVEDNANVTPQEKVAYNALP